MLKVGSQTTTATYTPSSVIEMAFAVVILAPQKPQ